MDNMPSKPGRDRETARDEIPEYRRKAAERLRQARSVVANSQADVARAIGITPMRWFRYESGERELNLDVLAKFCLLYGVCPRWIVIGDLKSHVRCQDGRRVDDDFKRALLTAYPEIRQAQGLLGSTLSPIAALPIAPRYGAKRSGNQGTSPAPGA